MRLAKYYNFFILTIFFVFCFFFQGYSQQSPTLLQKEAERHITAGRYAEAINMLNELIEIQPNSAIAYSLRSKCYENRSQLKLAVYDLRKAVKLNPNDAETVNNLNKLEKKWNDELNSNIQKIEKDLIINPNNYQSNIDLAELYIDKGNNEKAIDLYSTYIQNTNASPTVILRYGELLANNNKLKEGEKEFQKFAEKYPDNEQINIRYGYFNLWLGNFKKAETIFTQVLRKNPSLKEAQDGFKQAKSKGYFNPEPSKKEEIVVAKKSNPVENKIETYKSKIAANPKDYLTRLKMVNELNKANRFEESFDQLQIMLKDTVSIPIFSAYRAALIEKRDSVFNVIIETNKNKLSENPLQKNIVSKIADYYAYMNNYKEAMKYLSDYFNQESGEDGNDLRFRYAKYASWLGQFDDALTQLDYLLFQEPGNLDYQKLKGQILVWKNEHLELAEKYLENNIKAGNQSIDVILALATLYIQNDHITKAESYIDWAKTLDPNNSELKKVEGLYSDYQKNLNEKIVYSLIEEGRKFEKEGDYQNALIKFDEYFSSAKNPTKSEWLEYASLENNVKNLDRANEIYDQLLAKNYSYDVAMLRAKNILWKKDYKSALNEFQKLSAQNPDDNECKVFLGEAYQNLKQYSMANSIYKDVLDNTKNENIVKMINDRMEYMPQTGFKSLFTNFPSPIGFVPAMLHYSDNQDFSMNSIGGRLEIGIAKMLYGGVSYADINMYSSTTKRKFVHFKGHLFLNVLDNLQMSASFGTLNSINQPKKNTSDFAINFGDNKIFSTQFNYEHTDAALVLYSPYLFNLRYNVNIYKVSGFFEQSKKLRLSGYFSYLSIQDGNVGNDFQLRIGSQLVEDTYFGYESRYTSYKYDSPFVPYSNMKLKLYYSPQNLDTHSLWAEWNLEQSKNLNFTFGGEIGYIPNYNTVLREIEGKIKYNPLSNLILNLQLAAGSSYRYSSSYNYFSGSLSFYWRVY